MLTRVLTVVAIAAALGAPLHADLKYTMKMETKPSTRPVTAPANPMMAMFGPMVLGMIAPPGGLEMTAVVGERGSRFEYSQAYTVVPPGGAMIVLPDGTMIVTDPAKRTYWKTPKPSAATMGGLTPTVTIQRTGQSATIAGTRADHVNLDIRVALPKSSGSALPGMPAELTMTGEAWLSPAHKKYALLSGIGGGVGALGFDKISAEGFPVRMIMRSELFGDREIDSVVTSLAEVSVPATTFEVPAGYTEVEPQLNMPGMGGLGRGR